MQGTPRDCQMKEGNWPEVEAVVLHGIGVLDAEAHRAARREAGPHPPRAQPPGTVAAPRQRRHGHYSL